MFGVLPFVEYPELSATATLFNTHTVTDTRLQLQDHHHPIAIMTDLEDTATEDLAIDKFSIAISSAHHHHHHHLLPPSSLLLVAGRGRDLV